MDENGTKRINILGVDDRPENLLALEAVLEDPEIRLVKAHSGQEALEHVLKQDFALILMDVQMPEMNGFETAEVIRTNRRTGHIPIIFITAISFEETHVFKGYDTGAVDYLFKPIDPGILRSKVNVFIELFRQRENLRQKASELEQANRKIRHQKKALEESEVRFRTAFDQSFQFMAILDPGGRILEVNALASRLGGGNGQDIIGQRLWDVWRFDEDAERETLQSHIKKASAGQFINDEAAVFDTAKNRLFILRTVSPVRDEADNVIYIAVQGQNITHRKRAEEEKLKLETQLRQSQKMEALGTLAGGIAHDFNNLLSVILGYADMGRRIEPANTRSQKYFTKIRLASDKARDLVRQILCFTRRVETEDISFKPSSIVREAVKMLRATIPSTVEIHHDIDRRCGFIVADPTQLHQILINLCTNAHHAMEPGGGRLDVSVKETLVDESPEHGGIHPGQYAHICVADTGHGMDGETMEKIFDPYFTTKEVGKGTGLGLSIVHGIVKRQNGFIRVESEVGKGSRFHIYFPIIENPAAEAAKGTEADISGRGRILLVEDEESLLEMAREMLEMAGYEVTAVRSSREALSLFMDSPQRFDLVFTDQTMPQMTGVEMAQAILKRFPEFPIILCTGHSPDVTREGVREMGIRDLVLKPLAVAETSRVIRKALEK